MVADTLTMGSTPAATDVSDMARWSVLEGMLGPVFSFNDRCLGLPTDRK